MTELFALLAEARELNVRLHFNQRSDFTWHIGAYRWDGRQHTWAAAVELTDALRRCLDFVRKEFPQPSEDVSDLV